MPGINLSQSALKSKAEKKEKRASWTGTFVMSLFLVLVTAAWGGAYAYEQRLVSDISGIRQKIDELKKSVSSKEIDRIADFEFRTELIGQSASNRTHPESIFPLIESNMIPEVTLTALSYDEENRVVMLEGVANDFRGLVLQMTALKRVPDVSSLSVEDIGRDESGRVTFAFSMGISV